MKKTYKLLGATLLLVILVTSCAPATTQAPLAT